MSVYCPTTAKCITTSTLPLFLILHALTRDAHGCMCTHPKLKSHEQSHDHKGVGMRPSIISSSWTETVHTGSCLVKFFVTPQPGQQIIPTPSGK